MNVPPLELAPAAGLAVGPAVLDWNSRVSKLASNLSSTYNDTTVFRFDTYKLFTQVLSNVDSYPTSSQFKNATASCVPYDWSYVDMFDPSCGVSLREYLWMNNLHPTYPMHQTIASQIPKALDGAYGWHPYRRG